MDATNKKHGNRNDKWQGAFPLVDRMNFPLWKLI